LSIGVAFLFDSYIFITTQGIMLIWEESLGRPSRKPLLEKSHSLLSLRPKLKSW
jgi:hypothetical protein